jgi:phytanoyl-CoA hydroxylase
MSGETPRSAPRLDAFVPEHDPELYSPSGDALGVESLGDVGAEQVAFYREHGYLVVRRAFEERAVADAIEGLSHLIAGGRPDFEEIWFEARARERLEKLSPEERQDAVRKLMGFVAFDVRLAALAHAPALLDAIGRLMGGRRPALFQDMAMLKPPLLGREKPWHQDHAYFDFPLGTPVVGVWIALDEATRENGCMQVLPGMHRTGPIVHFQRRDWQICDTEMLGRRSVAAPLAPGGLLFFDGLLPHGTPSNRSARRRRAVQFHYAPDDATKAPPEARLAVFGSEGKDVSC